LFYKIYDLVGQNHYITLLQANFTSYRRTNTKTYVLK